MSDDDEPGFAYSRIPSGPSSWDDTPTHELVIDYAGNWIFKPIPPLTQAQPPASAPSPQRPAAPWEEP